MNTFLNQGHHFSAEASAMLSIGTEKNAESLLLQ